MTAKVNLRTELVLLGVLALLWGSSYLFIKVAVQDIPPLTLIALRVSGAALFLMAVVGVRGDRMPRDTRTWRMLLIQAFFNSIAAWTLLAWGQQYVDAGMASVLNSTSPIFVLLMTVFITGHETMAGWKLAGAMIGLAGVCLTVGLDAVKGLGDEVAGQIACLLGAALYGCAAIYGKRFGHISAAVTATGTMIWASVVLVPAALVIETPVEFGPRCGRDCRGAGPLGALYRGGLADLLSIGPDAGVIGRRKPGLSSRQCRRHSGYCHIGRAPDASCGLGLGSRSVGRRVDQLAGTSAAAPALNNRRDPKSTTKGTRSRRGWAKHGACRPNGRKA